MGSLPPPGHAVVETRTARLWLHEPGIVCVQRIPDLVGTAEDFEEFIRAINRLPGITLPTALLVLDNVPQVPQIRQQITQKQVLQTINAAALYLTSPKERYRAAFHQQILSFPFPNRIFDNLDDALCWLRNPQLRSSPPETIGTDETDRDEFLQYMVRFATGDYTVRLPDQLEPSYSQAIVPLINILLEEVSHAYGSLQQANHRLEEVNAELSAKNTQLLQLNQALQKTQERLFDFADVSSDIFWETDPRHRFNWVQTRDPNLPGGDLLGRTRYELKAASEEGEKWDTHLAQLDAQENFRDFEYQQPSGRWVRVSGKPIYDDQGRFQGYRGATSDITERHQLEEQYQEALVAKEIEAVQREADYRMLQQAKLAALGELATSVAHEVNNPLTFLKSVFQLWKEDLDEEDQMPEPEEFARDLRDGLTQVQRISEIVDHLRTFGRQDATEEQRLFTLQEPLNGALLLVNKALKNQNITFHNALPDDLPVLEGAPGQLEQVFLNLLNNAKDALAGQPDAQITLSAEVQEAEVHLQVSDNGPGIPLELQDQIFNSFFTTKPTGKGTGLGLAIVRKIIEGLGGRISCHSTPGHGATFTLVLPLPESGTASGSGTSA